MHVSNQRVPFSLIIYNILHSKDMRISIGGLIYLILGAGED